MASKAITGIEEDLPINTPALVFILITSIVLLFLAFFAINTLNSLIVLGVSLTFLAALDRLNNISGSSILEGEVSFPAAAFGAMVGALLFVGPSLVSGFQFSAFAAPTNPNAWLSLVSQTPTVFQEMIVGFIAPAVETVLFFTLGAVLAKIVRDNFDLDWRTTIFLVILVAGGVFAVMHGARTVNFGIIAATFMAGSLYFGLAADVAPDLPLVGSVAGTVESMLYFLFGLHLGNNIMAIGGPFAFLDTLLGATGVLQFPALLIVLFVYVLIPVGAAVHVYSWFR